MNNTPEEEQSLDPSTDNQPLGETETPTPQTNETPTPIGIAPPSQPEKPQEAAQESPKNPWSFSFHGEGSKYFVIQLVNALLRMVTFNFYYPWAKAAKFRYLFEQTEFAGSRFSFHGTGKEMFIGYLKIIGISFLFFFGIGSFSAALSGSELQFLSVILLYLGLIFLYPVAIHGTVKYRLSRTSWRGIFFGYDGKLGELFSKFIIDGLLTIITLGVYMAWFQTNLRKYIFDHISFGNAKFEFAGTGKELFFIRFKYGAILMFTIFVLGAVFLPTIIGISGNMRNIGETDGGFILSIIGLYIAFLFIVGVISIMMQREVLQFYVENTWVYQNDKWHNVYLNMTWTELLKLTITNMLLLVFTFGIAFPFVEIRTLQFFIPRISVEGTFDPNSLTQTQSNYKDATGEDMADWLDIDLV